MTGKMDGYRRQWLVCAMLLTICLHFGGSASDADWTDQLLAANADPNGYVVYCPCMGRFGNQADQFLGSLGFAHALNRTLVLPAWVEYQQHTITSVQVPFDTYFKVDPLKEYHRVITMETFMEELAPVIWPKGSRIIICHSARRKIMNPPSDEEGCHPKDGNPFKSFWDTYDVDFDKSEYHAPLHFHLESGAKRGWMKQFPPASYPVLAFVGPPSPFPVPKQFVKLHKYLKWSDEYASKAADFISKKIQHKPFLGIHLRNGIDFKNACEHMKTNSNGMFSVAQCIGYNSELGTATYETCYHTDKQVIDEVKKEVKRIGAKTVFVATDNRDMITDFLQRMKDVKFVRQQDPADPMLDLAILGQADHFIGNCISSFTAFVKRERDVTGKTSSFFAFTPKKVKEEL